MNYHSQPGATFAGSQWAQDNQQCVPPTTLQDFIYAFPKPRLSGRITKPRSAGNSPSSAGRRRTTTMHSSPMYRQLPNQDYQASLNAALLKSVIQHGRHSRPMSWHPASRQPEYPASSHYDPSTMAMHTFNLPVTQACLQPQQPISSAFNDEAAMLQTFAATEFPTPQQMTLPTAENQLPFLQDTSFLQVNNPQVDGTFFDGSHPGLSTLAQPISNDWPFDMVSINQSVPSVGVPPSNYGSVSSGRLTEPATPDFLPIQQFSDQAEPQSMSALVKPDSEDELVGMGLYNNPDAFADDPLQGMNGKGLKLEETFTPSSDNEADKEADYDDDDQQELNQDCTSQTQQQNSHHNASKEGSKPAESTMQKSFFFDDDFEQPSMGDHRPSFNIAAPPCMNYGYGWI